MRFSESLHQTFCSYAQTNMLNRISPPRKFCFLVSESMARRCGSNEYPKSMFLSRNKKNNVYPCKPQFYYIKVGFERSKLYRYVFVMATITTHNPPETPKEEELDEEKIRTKTNATYETKDEQTKQNCNKGTASEPSVGKLQPDGCLNHFYSRATSRLILVQLQIINICSVRIGIRFLI